MTKLIPTFDSDTQSFPASVNTAIDARVGAYSGPKFDRATGGNLAARYIPLGDSIARSGDNVDPAGTTLNFSDSYALYFALNSQGRVQLVRNAGVGGNTTDNMISRFDTDVTPYKPSVVSINAGTNDFTNTMTSAQFRTNIKTLVTKIRNIGALPVLLTMPPVNGAGAAQKLQIVQNNTWMGYWGAQAGIPVIDMYGAIADPATGNYLAAFDNGDGVHPNAVGHAAIGKAMSDVLSPMFTATPILTRSNVDPSNGVANGLMLNSTNGLADGFTQTQSVSSGTAVNSIITDALVPGKMQRVSFTGTTGSQNVKVAPNVGANAFAAVGDVVRLSCIVTKTAGMTMALALTAVGGPQVCFVKSASASLTRAVMTTPDLVIPAGTSALFVGPEMSGATGTIDYGQVTLTNVTTGALATL